jgi:hypothetical protein
MKQAITVAALLCAALSSFADDLVFRNGKDYIRLQEQPCSPVVQAHIQPQYLDRFMGAVAVVNGRQYLACWTVLDAARVVVVYEDADNGIVPIEALKPEPGI